MVVMVMVVVVVTPMAVVEMRVRMSPMMMVVFQVGSMVSVIMRGVSPIKLVFCSNLLETLSRRFRR